MSLRDANPYIDTDLALIISSFEGSLAKAQNEESVIAPFRREISALRAAPGAVIESVSSLPAFQDPAASADNAPSIPTRQSALDDDDEALTEAQNPSEDADDQEEWINKAKDWIEKCISCDIRTLTKFDPNFFKDIKGEWESALGKVDAALNKFENEVLNSPAVFSDVCGIANQLKSHCVPDLSKIIWLLQFMLSKLNREFEINMNIFESLIVGVLTPVFNAMIGNLDMIDKLAINPLTCVIGQLQSTASTFQNQSLRPINSLPNSLRQRSSVRGRVEERVTTRRQQVLENSRAQQATQKVSNVIADIKTQTDFKILEGYIQAGMNFVKNYKEFLIGLLREIIGTSTDSLNKSLGLAGQKIDLLRLIGLIQGIIDAAEKGEFSCGVDSDGLTPEDFKVLVNDYVNPNVSLEIVVEDDNLIVRRDRRKEDLERSEADASLGASYNASSGKETSGKETSSRKIPSNVVLTKKLSSCLKNVTAEEFSQVQSWIKGLEEGFSND